jgi:hypothetical protein
MAQFNTVADYIAETRTLLQDLVGPPYRYADADIVTSLNLAFLEINRLRPDILLDATYTGVVARNPGSIARIVPPSFSAGVETAAVALAPQYQMAVVYYITGNVQLRDSETVQDERASEFINKFTSIMLQVAS